MNTIRATNKPNEPVWKPYLYRKALTYVVGDPGIGKTTFGYALAQALGLGEAFMGLKPEKPLNILILDFESSDGLLVRKGMELGDFPDNVLVLNDAESSMTQLIKTGEIEKLYHAMPFDLLLIDNLGMAFNLRDENDNAEAEKHCKELRTIVNTYDCAILLYHHPSKNLEISGTRKGSGAYAWARYCNIHLNMNQIDKENGIIEIETAKNREDDDQQTRFIQKIGDSQFVECEPPADFRPTNIGRREYPIHKAMQIISQMKGRHSRADIVARVVRELDVHPLTADKALKRMLNKGEIQAGDYGKYDIP